MIYYIADTHFGNRNVLKRRRRPFASVAAMNEEMIEAWNARVEDTDTVYIIGNLFCCCSDPEAILKRLKGKKQLIVGEYDKAWMEQVDLDRYFESVDDYLEITDGSRKITLFRYPLLTWKNRKKSYMIFGHLLDKTEEKLFTPVSVRDRLLSAAVDINGFHPVTFRELVENNNAFWMEQFLKEWEDENGELPF